MPAELEVAHIPYERGGAYPGLFLFTGQGRLVRPVRQLPHGCLELLGTLEQVYLHIRWVHSRLETCKRSKSLSYVAQVHRLGYRRAGCAMLAGACGHRDSSLAPCGL